MQIYQEQFSPEKNNCFHIGHNILIEKELNWKWFLKNTLINIFQCFENNEVFWHFEILNYRKKHGKYEKEEIDAAIGYNKYVAESSSTTENFQSPDTVCKYCGEDFKFFRALKHHLRSHSSCPQKPFLCMRCDIGFSTKANCVRHLQKQHPEVSQYQIEQFIHVNEPSLLEDGEKSFGEGMSDDSQTADTMDSSNGLPPLAHFSTKSLLSTESRTQSPVKMEPVTIKQEPMDMDDDLPLDFSVNKSSASTPDIKPKVDELPIDLSVKAKETSDSPRPVSICLFLIIIKVKKFGERGMKEEYWWVGVPIFKKE